ncbi:ankyrin repeat-containing domain protein [Baffinella frigidus]|nr:ankyrin repeat-containing domain protein [Cryptophyta sp. CCMP2293]
MPVEGSNEALSKQHMLLDLLVFDAFRSTEMEDWGEKELLLQIASMRGWAVTAAYIASMCAAGGSEDWGGCHAERIGGGAARVAMSFLWRDVHDFTREGLPLDTALTDSDLMYSLEQVSVGELQSFIECEKLLELCISKAFIDSASYLHHTVHVVLSNTEGVYFRDGVDVPVDGTLYAGVDACLTADDGTVTTRDCDVCKLVHLLMQTGYVVADWSPAVVSADIYDAIEFEKELVSKNATTGVDMLSHRASVSWVIGAISGCHSERAKLLIERGYAVNNGARREDSPLHLVCYRATRDEGLLDVLVALDRRGADWSKRDTYGRFPIHCIAATGNIGFAQFARSVWKKWWTREHDIDRSVRDKNGRTPLHYAVYFNPGEMFHYMWTEMGFSILYEDYLFDTPLHELAKMGAVDCLEYVRTHGRVDLNAVRGRLGATLLCSAAQGCHKESTRYLLDLHDATPANPGVYKQSVAELLNERHYNGESMLFIACKLGRQSRLWMYIRFLVKRGACIDTLDQSGRNPIHAIAMGDTERKAAIQLGRLDCNPGGGACFDALSRLASLKPAMLFEKDRVGSTPLRTAVLDANEFVVSSLLRLAGRELELSSGTGAPAEFERWVNAKDANGSSALSAALDYGNRVTLGVHWGRILLARMRIAQMLIASGAEVTRQISDKVDEIQGWVPGSIDAERVSKMAAIRVEGANRGYGRLSKLPAEVYHMVSKEAVREDEALELLEHVNGDESEDDRYPDSASEMSISDSETCTPITDELSTKNMRTMFLGALKVLLRVVPAVLGLELVSKIQTYTSGEPGAAVAVPPRPSSARIFAVLGSDRAASRFLWMGGSGDISYVDKARPYMSFMDASAFRVVVVRTTPHVSYGTAQASLVDTDEMPVVRRTRSAP